MYDAIPVSLFEHVPFGVIISDKENTVRYLNRAAGELLDCERWAAIGSPCWAVMPLQTREDAIFCSYDCPVLVAIEAGERSPRQWALRCSRRGFSADVDVLTIPDPATGSGRYAYLHFIARSDGGLSPSQRAGSRSEDPAIPPASGREPPAPVDAAERLTIRPAAVRHHLQDALAKLGVDSHGKEVAAWLDRIDPSHQVGSRVHD